jgi:hypothetical protein
MVDKYPGRFNTEVLQDMPPHGYIIVFSGSHNTNLELRCTGKCHTVCAVRRGAEEGRGRSSNNGPKSTAATYSFPILLSLECRSAY